MVLCKLEVQTVLLWVWFWSIGRAGCLQSHVDTVSVPWLSQLICSKGTSNIQIRRSKRFQQVASAIFYSGCLACNLTMLYQQGPLRPCHSCSVHWRRAVLHWYCLVVSSMFWLVQVATVHKHCFQQVLLYFYIVSRRSVIVYTPITLSFFFMLLIGTKVHLSILSFCMVPVARKPISPSCISNL